MAALGARGARIAAFIWSELVLLVVAAASRLRRCSAGCSRRCSSRCSSTRSTRHPTTCGPVAVFGAARPVVVASALAAALLSDRSICRSPLGAVLREE